jgi:dUTP pyrophosphatase
MGATISYYFQSASLQSLIDYMTSYDSLAYNINDNNINNDNNDNNINDDYLDACPNIGTTPNDLTHDTHYKLFIYIHDFPGMEYIKQEYATNALKHNNVVEGYLKANDDANANANANEDVCYDSGFDLLCPENTIWTEDIPIYMLDFKISCAMTFNNKHVGYYLYMRSSTPIKTPLRLANNVGIIDSGYRGTIRALFDYNTLYSSYETFEFVRSNRYVQLTPPNIGCPMKVYIVDDLSMLGKKNNRNENGFGSSGN